MTPNPNFSASPIIEFIIQLRACVVPWLDVEEVLLEWALIDILHDSRHEAALTLAHFLGLIHVVSGQTLILVVDTLQTHGLVLSFFRLDQATILEGVSCLSSVVQSILIVRQSVTLEEESIVSGLGESEARHHGAVPSEGTTWPVIQNVSIAK